MDAGPLRAIGEVGDSPGAGPFELERKRQRAHRLIVVVTR
jgi:hypothetical protein